LVHSDNPLFRRSTRKARLTRHHYEVLRRSSTLQVIQPVQAHYLFGNINLPYRSIDRSHLASLNGPPATLQRDMRARAPPACSVRYALFANEVLALELPRQRFNNSG